MDLSEYKKRARLIKTPLAWVALREEMRKNKCTEADILEVNSCINKNDSAMIVEVLATEVPSQPVVTSGEDLVQFEVIESQEYKHITCANSEIPLKVFIPKEIIGSK